jgi:hypothetical protein
MEANQAWINKLVNDFFETEAWKIELRQRGQEWIDFVKEGDFESVGKELIRYTIVHSNGIRRLSDLTLTRATAYNSQFKQNWAQNLKYIDRLLAAGSPNVARAWKLWSKYVKNGNYDIQAALDEQHRIKQNNQQVSWKLKFVHIALQPEEEYVRGWAYSDAKKRTMETMEMTYPVLEFKNFKTSFLRTNGIQQLRTTTIDDDCVEFVKVKTDGTVQTIWFIGQNWGDMITSLTERGLLIGSNIQMEHGDVIEIRVDYVLERNWYNDEVGNTLRDLRQYTGIEYDTMTVDFISKLDRKNIDKVPEDVKERLLSFIRDILDIPDIETKLAKNILLHKTFEKSLQEDIKTVNCTLKEKLEQLLTHV